MRSAPQCGIEHAAPTPWLHEAIGRWYSYMNHVAANIGGVNVDVKTADQSGAVFRVVPRAKQKAALAFLSENIITTQRGCSRGTSSPASGAIPFAT